MRLRKGKFGTCRFYNSYNFIDGYIELTFSIGYAVNDKYVGYNLWYTKPNVKTFLI